MGVYIKGMEMPDFGYVCLKVFANGEVFMTKMKRVALVVTGINDRVGTAVPVPPHGRLIDADALYREIKAECNPYGKPSIGYDDGLKVLGIIGSTPPVIPAEPPKEEAKNFCGDCHWHESEEQYCFRKGCHTYDESSCELWEPMPAAEEGTTPYDLLYEEGGAGTT